MDNPLTQFLGESQGLSNQVLSNQVLSHWVLRGHHTGQNPDRIREVEPQASEPVGMQLPEPYQPRPAVALVRH